MIIVLISNELFHNAGGQRREKNSSYKKKPGIILNPLKI